MIQPAKLQGYLMVSAVVIIVIFALISAALVSMYLRATDASRRLQAIPAASALAESGLEQAKSNLTISTLSARQTCVGLSTTNSLATGDSITSLGSNSVNNPRYAYATLSGAIASNTTPTSITVNDSSVFTSNGWVLIGREVLQYGYIANATTLGGVSRAQDGSIATSHASGELVSQYQCSIAGIGHAPATNTLSIREYQQGMRQPLLFAAGQAGTLLRWNGPSSELNWEALSSGTTVDLNAVSALNYHSAWAVANTTNVGFSFARLQGNTWTFFSQAMGHDTNLRGVYYTSSEEAWAVGETTGGSTNILRWVRNGTNDNANWCHIPCSGITLTESGVNNPAKGIYAIKTYDLNGDGFADTGFAVGGRHDESGKDGVIWYYSGTGWSPITKAPLNYTLPSNMSQQHGVDITHNGNSAPKEMFSAGVSSISGGMLVRLRIINNAASWTTINTAQTLWSVSVIDTDGDGLADFGCAVGDSGYVILFDNNMNTTISTLPNGGNALQSVVVLSTTDIWVVGNNGARYHYDGTSWTLLTSNVVTTNNLYGVSAIYPQQTLLSGWHDQIN